MKILILALPRTGSTSLLTKIQKQNLKASFVFDEIVILFAVDFFILHGDFSFLREIKISFRLSLYSESLSNSDSKFCRI